MIYKHNCIGNHWLDDKNIFFTATDNKGKPIKFDKKGSFTGDIGIAELIKVQEAGDND